jgi:riboflavin kinase/FMN adenylyltransferase
VTNVGCKPTVNNSNKVGVETHILDYSGDLYGQSLRIDFFHFLRPEKKFPSVEALQEQMEHDIAETIEYYRNITEIC